MSQTMFAIAGLGTTELIFIVAILFLLFGATRLPQLANNTIETTRLKTMVEILTIDFPR